MRLRIRVLLHALRKPFHAPPLKEGSGARLWFSPDAAELAPGLALPGRSDTSRERNFSMRAIMLALAATFIFSGTMAGITTVRAQDSTTVIKHDDGEKTVIKKYNDDDADKKVIIKKHDD
jgi:hypothetical protein